jgi:hypothetical protein
MVKTLNAFMLYANMLNPQSAPKRYKERCDGHSVIVYCVIIHSVSPELSIMDPVCGFGYHYRYYRYVLAPRT